jgi:hypothetical protein
MKRQHPTLSVVREASPFAKPPRVVVLADEDGAAEAVQLAEALDGYGADAEVRLSGDGSDDRHSPPDAVVFAGRRAAFRSAGHHAVLVGVTDGGERAAGFDLVVSRPVDASALLEQLGDYLPRIKM